MDTSLTKELSSDVVSYFSSLIESEIGIKYTSINTHLLTTRLHAIAKNLGFDHFDAFWEEVKTRGLLAHEKSLVLDIATNNETTFFRDRDIFDFFHKDYRDRFTSSTEKIRIWCAACSTGQEPYTLAMIITELQEQGITTPYEIIASDISDRVLKQAESGIYSQIETQRGLPPALLEKYFDPIHTKGAIPHFQIKRPLRQSISFKNINLLKDWPHMAPFDIIFCRNVLIYQDVENKRHVVDRMPHLLKPDGYVVLGASESLLGISNQFEPHLSGRACVYKLKTSRKISA